MSAPAAAAAAKKQVVVVHVRHVDPAGRSEYSNEVWIGASEADRGFIEHCANNEKGRWDPKALDRFAKLRMRCWDPDATLKGAEIIDQYHVTIHYDNDDLMDSTTEEEEAEEDEESE